MSKPPRPADRATRRGRVAAGTPRSICPIANSLELLGDRWTLLVVRDLLFGHKRRYNEFMVSAEGITSNILADRLKRLEAGGIVERARYQDHPPRYEYLLTDKGRDLKQVLIALVSWGARHMPGSTNIPSDRLAELAEQAPRLERNE